MAHLLGTFGPISTARSPKNLPSRIAMQARPASSSPMPFSSWLSLSVPPAPRSSRAPAGSQSPSPHQSRLSPLDARPPQPPDDRLPARRPNYFPLSSKMTAPGVGVSVMGPLAILSDIGVAVSSQPIYDRFVWHRDSPGSAATGPHLQEKKKGGEGGDSGGFPEGVNARRRQ